MVIGGKGEKTGGKKIRKKDRQEEEKPRRPPSMENRLNAKGDSRERKESLKSLKQ